MLKRFVIIISIILVMFPSNAFADFTIHYDDDGHGLLTIPYFKFETFSAWSDYGGYFEVYFQPANNQPSEPYTLRLEGSQGKFYFEYCGNWTFFRKFENGEPVPGKTFFQFTVNSACSDYDDAFDKYQNLDPNNPAHWEGAAPINKDKNHNKPEPADRNPPGDDGNGDGGSGDDGGGNTGGNGDFCECIFNSEGWSDFMDKMDDVIGAIPPPPNWDQVADTFRDSIVPQVITDLDNLLGRAPNPPTVPSMPTLPNAPKATGSVNAPTGNAIPDVGQFDADDIKSGAVDIQVRDDPTGGFNILNPIDALPSQAEFKDNIPNEGNNYAPEVPEVSGTAPNPPMGNIPFPDAPEVSGTAPVPDNPSGNAPIPSNPGGSAPLPGGSGGNAPIPDGGFESFPMPGNDGSSAPIPNILGGNAPVPNE